MNLAALALAFAAAPPALDRGFELLYHLEFSKAREVFAAYEREHPASAMGPAGEAASYLFDEFERNGVLTTAFFLDDETLLGGIRGKPDAARMAWFHRAAARARAVANARLAKAPSDPEALLALILAVGMESDAAALIEKRRIEALRRIREADALARRLLAVAPDQGDAYMAQGAASYIIGAMPVYKRALLRLGGVRGDRSRGMEQLEVAARTGHYLRAYAKMLLALACLREKQSARALSLLNELIREFPRSPIFAREKSKFEAAAKLPVDH